MQASLKFLFVRHKLQIVTKPFVAVAHGKLTICAHDRALYDTARQYHKGGLIMTLGQKHNFLTFFAVIIPTKHDFHA